MRLLSKLDQFVLRSVVETTARLRRMPTAVAYLLVTIMVIGVELLRIWWLGGVPVKLPPNLYMPFFPIVVFAALCLDRYTGIYASILAGIASAATRGPVPHSIALNIELVHTIGFMVVGMAVATLIESLHHLYDRHKDMSERSDVLIQDLNHRVKNHLTSLASLINMSKSKVTPECAEVLNTASNRLLILSRLYDRLHLDQENAAVRVDAADFLITICEDLTTGIVGERDIAIEHEIAQVTVSAAKAVPLGLLVNELVTNSLKHAFPDQQSGTIWVSFQRVNGHYILEVSDDGVGGRTDKAGTGTRLIQNLVKQLGGKLVVSTDSGRKSSATFPASLIS